MPPDDHIAQACAAYGQRDRWSSRKPIAGSSDSDHSGAAEHKALSGSAAVDWKRTLDNWDRREPEPCFPSHFATHAVLTVLGGGTLCTQEKHARNRMGDQE